MILKKSCQKANHNLEYHCVKWTDNIDQLLQCSKCIFEDEYPIFQKILISDLLNEDYKESQIQNWPPLQDKNQSKFVNSIFRCYEENPSEENVFNYLIQQQIDSCFKDLEFKICSILRQINKDVKIKFQTYTCKPQEQDKTNKKQDIKQIIENFKIDDFKTKMKEFLDNKINIEQFFQFQQGKNDEFVNKYGKHIDEQFEKFSEISEQFQRLKNDLNGFLSTFNQYEFLNNEKIDLKFQKSKYNDSVNYFQINPENKQITFDNKNYNYLKQVYSGILENKKTYHLKIRIDAKGQIQNQHFYFGINSQQNKDQQLNTTNYIYAFQQQNNTSGSKNFKKEGKFNRFCDVFTDNLTILNIIFNINKKTFEIFDDKNQLKCSIELQEVKQPVFYIATFGNQCQTELYIDSIEIY
ncbi:hypothetical protein PPERSA_00537 [Pseudocohnilembus persalinus]|uniref:Uncharacterized protein n=1 Tax=Pseudocohnilembus persalinus TaxID=266149 RepID=A0A0V0QHR7_PSEPJ|nr:hypothetical protein PPERSA_00537 [Pseudocohnilembus persalinus]|eukprot:KRX01827.1 hypothetical protein PPERSA_00537 [Pseudocohnilembus persalinus]